MPKPKRHDARSRRDRLVSQTTDLVPPIARAYAHSSGACVDDLMQVGLMGLLQAASRYRRDFSIPFSAFARPHIRGSILHYLRDQAHLVRLPRRQQEKRMQMARCEGALSAIQESPGPCQLHSAMELKRWEAMSRPLPLDEISDIEEASWQSVSGSGGCLAIDLLGRSYRPQDLDPRWQEATLVELLNLVSHREQQVLRKVVLKGWSYRQTGQFLGVSAATVQRILHRALADLRNRLSEGIGFRPPAQRLGRGSSAVRGC